MSLSTFRQEVTAAERRAPPGGHVKLATHLDGRLFDERWCDFLRAHDVLVRIPMDGTPRMHDADRAVRGHSATHHRMLSAVRLLRRYGIDCDLLCSVHSRNAGHPLTVYRYLRDEVGAPSISFVPVVARAPTLMGARAGEPPGVTVRTVRPAQWGRFLIEVFDEWVRHDVGRQAVQIFDAALSSWLRMGSCGVPGLAGLPVACRCCRVSFACDGGLPEHRFVRSSQDEPGLDYLCDGYKEFYIHIDQPMRAMAALLRSGREAADIMSVLARWQDTEPRRLTGTPR